MVLHVQRPLPDGAVLEARFEDPATGAMLVLQQPARPGRKGYKFESQPLSGVEAERDYRTEVRLLAAAGGEVLESHARSYRSAVDQTILPKRPRD